MVKTRNGSRESNNASGSEEFGKKKLVIKEMRKEKHRKLYEKD
jgi:hypothetical protein